MDQQTLLHRQVNPSFIQSGRVTSQVFRPTPKDEGMLSVSDGSKITAESAYLRFILVPQCRSKGVLSVSVEECCAQGVLPVPDPIEEMEHQLSQPDHCFIDFRNISSGRIDKIATQLRNYAIARGWSYGPVE